MRRVILFSFVFVIVISLAGVKAGAQSPTPSGQELAERAKRDHDLGRLNEAIDGYARAYQILGDSGLLFSLAEAHRDAGHKADALKLFHTYLRRDPNGVLRESAEKQIKDLERPQKSTAGKASAPPPFAPPAAKAPASVAPPAAKAPAPFAPPAAVVPPPVTATPVTATPSPPPPPPSLAAPVPIASEPTPIATVDLTAAAPPPAVPGVSPPLPRWVPWALAATTVALGAGAIVSGLSASHRYDELRDACGQTTGGCPADQIDDVKSRALRANILWALAGVAALGTGVTVYVNAQAAGAAGLWRF